MLFTLCQIDNSGIRVVQRDLTPTLALILKARNGGAAAGFFILDPNGKVWGRG